MEDKLNEKVLNTLEYNKIIDRLQTFAGTEMSRRMCLALKPMTDIGMIRDALLMTNDALARSTAHHVPSLGGFSDCIPCVNRCEAGGLLSARELLNISAMLDACAVAVSYSKHKEEEDSLSLLFNNIDILTALNAELKRCIISDDEISDDASAALKDIRRHIKAGQDKIHNELTAMLNSSSVRTYLQDFVITTRGGRYCLPVKAEYKSNVPGMVHDQSATGSTLFIEPMPVVKLNNDLKELYLKETAEIEAILAHLSAECAECADVLKADQEALTRLDFIFAKASLSELYKCSCPIMNEEGYINIKSGRHPLIEAGKAVPIDIRLGREFDLLVITGPNTGGKTVSLKTVGLLTLMGQSGLNIPAFDNSELAVFKKVYADIGDEQSIEQSLSTFSSHMTNTVKILRYANKDTLILFDEIGAGTDPVEGAALATAVLNDLHRRKIRTIATTHYSELKVYALSTPGVENACCEFDVESLRPTYRLLIGVPGKSNAFAISGRLGLPDYIIKDAQSRLETQDIQFEDILTGLENSRSALEDERRGVNELREETARLKKELQEEQDRLNSKKTAILDKASQEAAEILQEAKDYADETIRTMNKHGMTVQELEQSRAGIRNKISSVRSRAGVHDDSPKLPAKKHKPSEFTLGTRVRVLSMNLIGTVNSKPDAKGNVFVMMGVIRTKVNINDLEIIEEDAFGNAISKASPHNSSKAAGGSGIGGSGRIRMSKASSISPEINLLGCTVDEAVAKLDKYLDDAYLAGISPVRIVHGKGTGALRNAVSSYLNGIAYIKSYRPGEHGEGDAGVTIVEFK